MLWETIEKQLNKKKITAYRLSKMTGVSTQTISALKTGKITNPRFEIIVKIATALDIDLNEFKEKETK
ncbi:MULTISPECIES: helix-turn-helix transcriptional regulator [unclassified Lactococcus]|uniref:helix-turn-helix domain-containing protein n=1 Tax=unclassified Lactococcus TaxID=2643510 RepID=UPI0011C72B41|nr:MULTISPECIES: helix-turn-helix transcriptional regulator [unclassified Lactococcus]MQW24105.1 helix-turn-helix domain-containing protein [Lactococcus sp. dk101]TXK33900.1 helix-turn-helix transcriptional regulator [Lactococcus sp. dk310]TXK45325.1 helix-turn-helix transcriptional regulator [Lactococcus sp. dk322]